MLWLSYCASESSSSNAGDVLVTVIVHARIHVPVLGSLSWLLLLLMMMRLLLLRLLRLLLVMLTMVYVALSGHYAVHVFVLHLDIFAIAETHTGSAHHVARYAGWYVACRRAVLVRVDGGGRAGYTGGERGSPGLAVGHWHILLGGLAVVGDVVGWPRGKRGHSGTGNGTTAVVIRWADKVSVSCVGGIISGKWRPYRLGLSRGRR